MNQLAVSVREIPLDIETCRGKRLQAHLFLHDFGQHGPERLLQRLNDSELFLPLKVDGQVQLMRKSAILRMSSPLPLQEVTELRQLGVPQAAVEILLDQDRRISGNVFLLMPSTRNRVSDVLNGPDQFLLIETALEIAILNKNGIDAVQPMEGAL